MQRLWGGNPRQMGMMSQPGFRWRVPVVFVAAGFFAQLTQILLLRELMVVLSGDELALGIMLAVWLFFVGLGALWARALVGNDKVIGPILLFSTVSLPLALALLRLSRGFLDAPLGTPLGLVHTLVLSLVACCLPALGAGLLFVVLVGATRASPALTYAGESLGALLGGVLFVFALVGALAPVTMAALAAFVLVLAGTCWSGSRWMWGLLLFWLGGLFLGGPLDGWLESQRWRQMLPAGTLVETTESPYGRWSALRLGEQWSFFLDSQHHSDLSLGEETIGELVNTAMLQNSGPKKVLFIGGCLLGAPQALLQGASRVDCPELNALPWRSFTDVWRHEALHLVADDPVGFLQDTSETYDVIIHDGQGPNTVGQSRLYGVEFFGLVAQKLAPDGVLALSLPGQYHQLGDEVRQRNAVVYHSIGAVLPKILVSPGDPAMFLATAAGGLTLDREVLLRRLEEVSTAPSAYKAWLYTDPFPVDQMMLLNRSLASWPGEPEPLSVLDLLDTRLMVLPDAYEKPPLNTLEHPRAYWYTRLAQTAKFEPQWLALFQRLPVATRMFLGSAGLVLLGLGLHGRSRPRPRRGLTLSSGASAFAAMTLQIVVLLWFQSVVGQAYVGLALLSAALMAGVSLGALGAHFCSSPVAGLRGAQLSIVAVGGLLWLLLPFRVAPLSVLVAILLGGLLGLHFGCAAALWPGRKDEAARWLYGADLFGGAMGALLVAAIVIPADGMVAALVWAGLFAVVAIVAVSPKLHASAHRK